MAKKEKSASDLENFAVSISDSKRAAFLLYFLFFSPVIIEAKYPPKKS